MSESAPAQASSPAPTASPSSWLARAVAAIEIHERIALLFVAATWLLFVGYGFRSSWSWVVQAYGWHLLFVTKAVLGIWLPLWLYRLWRRQTTLGGGLREIGAYGRGALTLLAVTVAYTHLKARKLGFNPQLLDPYLMFLDDWLFAGGDDFIAWVSTWNRDPIWTIRMESIYAWSALAMGIPLGIAFGLKGSEVVRRAFAALVLCYSLGALLYIALPALGPAFVRPEAYEHLAGTRYHLAQFSMLKTLRAMAASRDFPVIPWHGIAAFPSLHVGIAWLGVSISWTYVRVLVPICLATVALIGVSALWFGWHYAIDFPPGALLAIFAWWAAGKMIRKPAAVPERSPAHAPFGELGTGETTGPTVG